MARRILIFACLCAAWCCGTLKLTDALPVSLQFSEGQSGAVSLHGISEGGAVALEEKAVSADASVTFFVPRKYDSFGFSFAEQHSPYSFASLNVAGIKFCDGEEMARYTMRGKCFRDVPASRNEPLLLYPSKGVVLELTNVFPSLLKMWKMARILVPFSPVAILFAWLFWRMARRQVKFALAAFLGSRPAFIVLCIGLLVLSLPPPAYPVATGLDPSWMWLLNHFAFTGAIGRDFVFTYGPLGFLIYPQESLVNVIAGVAVNLAFTASFAFSLLAFHRNCATNQSRYCALALLALWVLPAWPNGMEWKWCAASVLSVAVAVFFAEGAGKTAYALMCIGAATGALQSFIKFSSCIAIIGAHAFLVAAYLLQQRRKALLGACLYLGTFAVCAIIGFHSLFPDWSSVLSWVRGSIEVASGYNLYMCTDKSWLQICVPVAIVCACAVQAFTGKERRRAFLFWVSFSPLLFCVFKYGMVRQGCTPLALMVAMTAILMAAKIPEKAKSAFAIAAYALVAGIGLDVLVAGGLPRTSISLANLLDTLRCGEAMRREQSSTAELRREASLPSAWLESIGTNTTMVAGTEMSPAMEGQINLVPFPATQTYSAYTPYLDRICAERVARRDTAYLLVPADPWTFDSRNIYFDNPRLWQTVRENYSFVAANDVHVLLKLNQAPQGTVARDAGVFAYRRPTGEKISSLFLRTPRAFAHFEFADGTKYTCAANGEVLDGTPMPAVLPTRPEHVPAFFGGPGDLPRVRTIQIGTRY